METDWVFSQENTFSWTQRFSPMFLFGVPKLLYPDLTKDEFELVERTCIVAETTFYLPSKPLAWRNLGSARYHSRDPWGNSTLGDTGKTAFRLLLEFASGCEGMCNSSVKSIINGLISVVQWSLPQQRPWEVGSPFRRVERTLTGAQGK